MPSRKRSIRVSGLVRFSRQVQEHLREGVPEELAGEIERRVQECLNQIEDICQKNGATPEDLPVPSRRAYYFLKELDLSALPRQERGTPRPPKVRLSNVVRNLRYFHYRANEIASAGIEEADIEEMQSLLMRWTEQIDQILEKSHATPDNLEKPTRKAYALFVFLKEQGRVFEHVDTIARFHQTLKPRPEAGPPVTSIRVEMGLISHLYSYERQRNQLFYRLNESFIGTDDAVLEAIAACIHEKKPARARGILNEYQDNEAFTTASTELELLSEPQEARSQGRYYDLADVFTRVNNRYFGGQMDQPRLRWSDRQTFRKFGHYRFASDEVMLSATLDRPEVPRFLVEYVMYHELLHKKHGCGFNGSRRVYHPPRFRADEKKFERYKEAEIGLTRLSKKARRFLQW